jgi:competence protein ComEC
MKKLSMIAELARPADRIVRATADRVGGGALPSAMRKLWLVLSLALGSAGLLRAADTLEIYWVDVEGGGGTLIVTAAKESILIDMGWAGERDAARIQAAATAAGVNRIDFLILTHFHADHFGGAANIAKLMPIGTVYDNGIPEHDPDGGGDARFLKNIQPYREFKAEHRQIVHPGEFLPLKQAPGTPAVSLGFVAAKQKTIAAPAGLPPYPLCNGMETRADDPSDNKNSVSSLVQYGPFRFFDGGDTTWNMEARLVCPVNLPGPVDVYQVDHHGMDISNNPILIKSLAPRVSVMNNGPRKGGAVETVAALKSSPGLQAMYQVHRDLVRGGQANTTPEQTANLEAKCAGNYIKLTAAPDGRSYTISIPATGHQRTFQTKE